MGLGLALIALGVLILLERMGAGYGLKEGWPWIVVALGVGNIFREAYHPSLGDLRREAESVRGAGRHQDGGRRGERHGQRLVAHLAAARFDQQQLEQVAVAVRTDRPVVDRRTRSDGLDMDEVECGIVRRVAVQMKQRKCGGRHGGQSICERERMANAIGQV